MDVLLPTGVQIVLTTVPRRVVELVTILLELVRQHPVQMMYGVLIVISHAHRAV